VTASGLSSKTCLQQIQRRDRDDPLSPSRVESQGLGPKLLRDLKSRHPHRVPRLDMGDWLPDKKTVIHTQGSFLSNFVFNKDATYHLWVVPGNAAGRWALEQFPPWEQNGLYRLS